MDGRRGGRGNGFRGGRGRWIRKQRPAAAPQRRAGLNIRTVPQQASSTAGGDQATRNVEASTPAVAAGVDLGVAAPSVQVGAGGSTRAAPSSPRSLQGGDPAESSMAGAARGRRNRVRADGSPLLCDICESPDHVAPRCPVLRAPRSSVQFVGIASSSLGYCVINSAGNKKKQSASLLVRVVGGSCPADVVLQELKRIVPIADWQWTARPHGDDAFIVPFPSQLELDGLVRFEELHVRNPRIILQFELWSAHSQAKFEIPKVWARVHGVPEEIHDFDRLWNVGELAGETLKIDMVFTRKHKIPRILIGIVNPAELKGIIELSVDGWMHYVNFELEDGHGVSGDDDDGLLDDFRPENGKDEGNKDMKWMMLLGIQIMGLLPRLRVVALSKFSPLVLPQWRGVRGLRTPWGPSPWLLHQQHWLRSLRRWQGRLLLLQN